MASSQRQGVQFLVTPLMIQVVQQLKEKEQDFSLADKSSFQSLFSTIGSDVSSAQKALDRAKEEKKKLSQSNQTDNNSTQKEQFSVLTPSLSDLPPPPSSSIHLPSSSNSPSQTSATTPPEPSKPPATVTLAQVHKLSELYRNLFPNPTTLSSTSSHSSSTSSPATSSSPPFHGFVFELLRGSFVHNAPPPKKRRDPEFEKYLQELRIKQERREYQQLVKDLPGNAEPTASFGSEYSAAQRELSTGVNILSLMITGFVVFWYAGSSMFPDSNIKAIFCGFGGLVAAMFLEIFLFLVRDQKEQIKEDKKQKQSQTELEQSIASAKKRQAAMEEKQRMLKQMQQLGLE